MKKINKLLLLILTVFFVQCSTNTNNENTENTATTEATEIETLTNTPVKVNAEKTTQKAICVWEKLMLREKPTARGKLITSIYLGETSTFFGETARDDASNKDFFKIKLTDGTEGWVESKYIILDAQAYTVVEDTKLYKRPDVLTATEKTLDKLQYFVAITEQEDWLEIKVKTDKDSWFTEGWVKADQCSKKPADVTVAILAKRAMAYQNDEKKKQALNDILANSDFKESVFLNYLENILIKMAKLEAGYTDSLKNMID